MFGRNRHDNAPLPKMTKEHREIREEVVKSRELLLKEIDKLNRKFNLNRTKRKP